MGVELIKDQKGKNHMVFNKDISKEDLLMGEKIDDYEILQVLGEGSFGYVAKAKSRLNHKIYAIKQLKFSSEQKKKEIEMVENEVAILKNLEHPLITKYYKSFKEGDCLYMVMEFMDNGDLGKLIKGHKTLNKPIEEERIWNIFIQCLKSLEFVHSKGIIHRDIKPENLFISNDGTIKIGDFGVSANFKNKNNQQGPDKNKEVIQNMQNLQNIQKMANMQMIGKIDCKGTVVGTAPFMSPEMIKNVEYDLTTDVYSMGCSFFETMYWSYPRLPSMDIQGLIEGKNILKLIDNKIKFNKDVYSKELVNLVMKMIEIKKEIRPDSTTILNLFISEYNKKYCKSSSIGSVLTCLYTYPEIIQYFINQNNVQILSKIPNSISYAFLYGLNSIFSINMNNGEDWKTTLFKIRSILSNHNSVYQSDNEINPRMFLSFLFGRIHKELNLKKGGYQNPFSSLFSLEINNQGNINNINYSNKEESYNYFIQNFKENNDSLISNNFYGNMKTKTVCLNCQLTTYTYNSFNYITFNLDLIKKYLFKKNFQNMYNQLNINQCFIIQNDILVEISNLSRHCRNCKQNSRHSERKQFRTFPRYLIVALDRGADCENKNKIYYNDMLDLSGQSDNPASFSYFMLKGIVKRMDTIKKEHYISIYFDFNQKSWIVRDDTQITKIASPLAHNQGIEVMFFYEAIINNNNNNNVINTMNSNMNINLNNVGMGGMNQNQNNMNGNGMGMNNINTNMSNFNNNMSMNNNMNNNNMNMNNMNNYNNMGNGMYNNMGMNMSNMNNN